ncbi:MAG: ABC transporter substrate-binding protein [Gemmatimonadaceae bacterium]|nr:ABC transporter substrate-binding protein [Gemmatimonadaceae bacterium]
MTRFRRSFFAVALAALLVGSAIAQTITYGMGGNFDQVDPNLTTFTRVGRVTLHVVEPLVWQPTAGVFEGALATSWSVNDDATEYTFQLRDDVTFHDGTPFTAEAVKFTFDRIVDPEMKAQTAVSLIGPYERSEILGEHEVKIVFSRSFAPFLDSASKPNLGIISPTAYAAAGEEAWGMDALVGTGPFRFVSYTPGDEIVLERYDEYAWGAEFLGMTGPSAIERLVYKIIPEPSTRTASIETGETDFIEEVAAIDFGFLDGRRGIQTLAVPQSGSGWSLMMNAMNPPMDELAVRRAIQLASDSEGMTVSIWNGIGEVPCGPISSITFTFDPATCEMYPYDPEGARATLEADGWIDTDGDGIRERDGQRLVIGHYYRADSAQSVEMADFMKADLATVGIEVELNGLSSAGYFDAVRAGQHHTQNWWDPFTDPNSMRILFHSDNAGGGTNRNNYIDAEMDELLAQGAATPDPERRAEIYAQIQAKVKDEAIMVFYNDPASLYAFSADLHGVVYFGAGQYPYFYTATVGQ